MGEPDRRLLRYLIVSLSRSGQQEQARAALLTYLEHYGLDEEAMRLIRDGSGLASRPTEAER
jgi:hypothetical protein